MPEMLYKVFKQLASFVICGDNQKVNSNEIHTTCSGRWTASHSTARYGNKIKVCQWSMVVVEM